MLLLKILAGIVLSAAPPVASVPIETDGGGAVVRVTVNGKGPFPFALAARSGPVLLSESLFRTAGLETEAENQPLLLDRIAIGDLLLEKVPARPLQGRRRLEMSMTMGELPLGQLDRFLVTVDYPGGLLTIANGELPPEDGRGIVTLDRNEEGEITVPLQVDGLRVTARLLLGINTGLTMGDGYNGRLPLLSDREIAGYIQMSEGLVNLIRSRFAGPVRIGRQDLFVPSILFDPREPEASLGLVALRDHAVILDQTNRRLSIVRRDGEGG